MDEIASQYEGCSADFIQDLALLRKLGSCPKFSGFLRIRAKKSCFALSAPRWKEGMCILTKDRECTCISYCLKRHGQITKINIDTRCRAFQTPATHESGWFCFQVTNEHFELITLAAPSEYQMRSWISCLNSA